MLIRPGSFHDIDELRIEMQRVLPSVGPKVSQKLKNLRIENEERTDRALRLRQRPTRVS